MNGLSGWVQYDKSIQIIPNLIGHGLYLDDSCMKMYIDVQGIVQGWRCTELFKFYSEMSLEEKLNTTQIKKQGRAR